MLRRGQDDVGEHLTCGLVIVERFAQESTGLNNFGELLEAPTQRSQPDGIGLHCRITETAFDVAQFIRERCAPACR